MQIHWISQILLTLVFEFLGMNVVRSQLFYHDIADTHVLHHFFSTVTHYHAHKVF